jgi:hypothetical protein
MVMHLHDTLQSECPLSFVQVTPPATGTFIFQETDEQGRFFMMMRFVHARSIIRPGAFPIFVLVILIP